MYKNFAGGDVRFPRDSEKESCVSFFHHKFVRDTISSCCGEPEIIVETTRDT